MLKAAGYLNFLVVTVAEKLIKMLRFMLRKNGIPP